MADRSETEAVVAMRLVIVAEPARETVADRSDTEAVVAMRLVIVAEEDLVTVADKSEMDAVVARRLVIVADEAVSTVTFAEAMLRFERVRLTAVRFVIEAEAMVATLKDALSATISSTVIAAASWYAIVPKYWLSGISLGAEPISV